RRRASSWPCATAAISKNSESSDRTAIEGRGPQGAAFYLRVRLWWGGGNPGTFSAAEAARINVMVGTSLKILAAAACLVLATSGQVLAQVLAQGAAPPAKPAMTESCPGLVATRPPFAQPAAFRLAALNADQVRIDRKSTRLNSSH